MKLFIFFLAWFIAGFFLGIKVAVYCIISVLESFGFEFEEIEEEDIREAIEEKMRNEQKGKN